MKERNLYIRNCGAKEWYIVDLNKEQEYLTTSGKIGKLWKDNLDGKALYFTTKELAEQALENYNNNGEVMKRVSIEDDNGKKYEFETDREDVVLLKVVKDKLANSRIIGYADRNFIDPLTWSLRGTCLRGQTTINLTPYDQFKDLKRVCNEGAIIEYRGGYPWEETVPAWYDYFEYRIKGNISIESWDKHKEVIKEFWNGAKIEMSIREGTWCVVGEGRPQYLDWDVRDIYRYRVKPKPKVEELSIQQLENMLGYKIKIVKEGV